MSVKYAYYPGCTAETIGRELDLSTRLIAPKLGIELLDIPWSCCGGGTFGEFGHSFTLGMHARVFALCEEAGVNLLTVCNTCLVNLRKSNEAMKADPAVLAQANMMLDGTGLSYSGGIEVTHMLWAILDDVGLNAVSEQVAKPLKGLKLAPFYGCHILRPSYALGKESSETPRSLHDLIGALGAQAVEYEGYNKCCGFHVLFSKESSALSMAGERLECAISAEADAMVTPCPLCHVALDSYQTEIRARRGGEYSLPILHMSQLIGLAMGISHSELGFQRHVVSARTALSEFR